ncbi:unannotated protein [freshwater metagenome]|uniref:Unannotated protein n=1 Tax=freshwater metagenome TaxID=449393 RepID=A0A6J7PA57_9ZZZZ
MCVAANHDWLGPPWNQTGNVRADDGLTKNHAAQNVADGAIGGAPHLLQAELFDPRLVWRDGCALHAHAVFFDGVGSINGDLILGCIAGLNRKVEVLQLNIKVRKDELLLDEVPDDASHLVSVEFYDWVLHLDLGHAGTCSVR